MVRKTIAGVLIIAVLILGGCKRRDTSKTVSFEQEKSDYTLMILTDVDTFKNNPKATDFVTYAVDYYFNDRVGTNDQIILSQLSGDDHPVIFHGTPTELRKEMTSAQGFRDFIASHSKPGRRVNDGVCTSLKYLSKTYGVKKGGAVPVTLVVSSMIDESSKASEEKVVDDLIAYGKSGGKMAYYFVDLNRMDFIEERMEKAGFSFVTLECDVRGRPPLPTFYR